MVNSVALWYCSTSKAVDLHVSRSTALNLLMYSTQVHTKFSRSTSYLLPGTLLKKIFLIDGSSYLYRAFHAMPPLTTSLGLPTGAVKGVTNMLRNLRKENPDSYYLSIFDAKGKNFRHDIYKDYKANRPPMPEDLREQLSPLKEICNAMGMPVIEIPKVEADDVIATGHRSSDRSNVRRGLQWTDGP